MSTTSTDRRTVPPVRNADRSLMTRWPPVYTSGVQTVEPLGNWNLPRARRVYRLLGLAWQFAFVCCGLACLAAVFGPRPAEAAEGGAQMLVMAHINAEARTRLVATPAHLDITEGGCRAGLCRCKRCTAVTRHKQQRIGRNPGVPDARAHDRCADRQRARRRRAAKRARRRVGAARVPASRPAAHDRLPLHAASRRPLGQLHVASARCRAAATGGLLRRSGKTAQWFDAQ